MQMKILKGKIKQRGIFGKMVQILKIKEQIFQFVGRFEIYVLAVIRFILAFTAFTIINANVGFMEQLTQYPVALLFAIVCAFVPSGVMLFLGAVLILLNFYALSSELCVLTLLLFIVLFCLYFRFCSRKGMYTMFTGVLSFFKIPYIMPVSVGLLEQPYSSVSVICGSVVYFLLKQVKENAALFSPLQGSSDRMAILSLAAAQIFENKEMYLYLAAFASAAITVYCVRRSAIDHAREIAVLTGIVIQFAIVCGGQIYFGNFSEIIFCIIGCVVSLLISLGVGFMTLSLDYSRVEYAQFEDDEYYYYVKAVPKASVPITDKQVKKIHSKRVRTYRGAKLKKEKDADNTYF